MNFYLDENIPPRIASALNILEGDDGHFVFSTELEFGKGIKDDELFYRLQEASGILITNDLKQITRRNEITLLKELGITSFVLSFPSGSNFELKYRTMILHWEEIKRTCRKNQMPFICRITAKGKFEILS